ncbi:MAG: chromosome segregation protein SMC [Dermatophilus congolensis]|nr:chromosome segregation protein SMC [Dermatophilus congolensis]
MYVANLTLRGFKSFASATSFTLEPGITCVVGPNGSGKSNVVDALAWVMGEQGAKSLRGGKMEDVIFAGTPGRPPLGRAQVTMTIDNHDGALPIDYSEVTISRTMFRSGSSEYSINGTACRLLDVQELLSDSGIGKEMHVIVGQGQLDTVLRSTPIERRGLIEEAAGVLKHRKRKEKALRKLEAMEGNLTRLVDLATEVRRQLGPLGRQAETARKAATWQAELRDARLRILADDLVQRQATLTQEETDDSALRRRVSEVEARIASVRGELAAATERGGSMGEAVERAGQVVFDLVALRDRFTATGRLAAERARSVESMEAQTRARTGRDPQTLREEAARARAQEEGLRADVTKHTDELASARATRGEAEEAHTAERERVSVLARAAADRREGLARLAGQVAAKESRIEAIESQLARTRTELDSSRAAAAKAERDFVTLEAGLADNEDGEAGLDEAFEAAEAEFEEAASAVDELQATAREAESERDQARARREALEMGLRSGGGAQVLLAEDAPPASGTMASLLTVETGWEAPVAAALGSAAEAVAYGSLDALRAGLAHLRAADAGRASLVVAQPDLPAPPTRLDDVLLPAGAVWAADVVRCADDLRPVIEHLLAGVALVADDDEAMAFVQAAVRAGRTGTPVTAVTRAGDVFTPGLVRGGSGEGPSLIEVQAARDEAAAVETEAGTRLDRTRFASVAARERLDAATAARDAALNDLHASDASMAALAEKLGELGATLRAAKVRAEKAESSIAAAEQGLGVDRAELQELRERLAAAEEVGDDAGDEPSGDELARLETAATSARAAETAALLATRTAEERLRGISGRADSLEAAATSEERAREAAGRRRVVLASRLELARTVQQAARRAATRVDASIAVATAARTEVQAERSQVEAAITALRARLDEASEELRTLTDAAHRDEVARAELRLRIEALQTRAMDEFGITADVLVDEFGPDRLIPPVLVERDPDGTDAPAQATEAPRRRRGRDPLEPRPYVREEQEEIVATREKKLARLGRINPLALEEFAALEERHAFLTGQIEDLRAGKRDLLDIVKEVDDRVERAFEEAYADTAREFEGVFSRLFPGGEGRLVLTDPADMLTTGIEVEARPPGKKIKRLSLLSGGERSLTAMALLVAIFKARPSPFYIMDEVEAALDDVNLGRLITLFEELRENSQLIVITHQKRTMEIADALYGVTMRGDGVTTVVSQRLRESA